VTSELAAAEPREGAALAAEGERASLLAELDSLYAMWGPKAQEGDAAAALIVLSIMRQRASLLGVGGRSAAALRVAASSLPSAEGTDMPGEVKLVVEYVNDWREVLRRRA
jgi:hypothetical protein